MSAIIIEKKQKIAYLTLNRVDKYNAFDDAVIDELINALDELAACDQTSVIILNANGKHFSAGADLAWMKRMVNYSQAENHRDSLALAALMHKLHYHPKVTIASVKGFAFGGGVGLVAACDFAVCDNKAKFCFSEVKLGLIPAVISPFVIKAIGERMAKKLFFTAEQFNSQQAFDFQLVQQVFEVNELEQKTFELATEISQNGPQALTACKSLVNNISSSPISEEIQNQTAAAIAERRVSPEGQEGLGAFFEKRTPNWHSE